MTAAARTGDTVEDGCPKLGGLGGGRHEVGRRGERIVRGRRKERCTYCSRSIDLGPAELAAP